MSSTPTCPVDHAAAGARPAAAPPAVGVNPRVPGPAPMPIVGWRGNVARYFRDPIAYMTRMRREHGPVACLVRGGNAPLILKPTGWPSSTVFGFDAAANRQVLSQPELFERDLVRVPERCPWLAENMSSANRQDRVTQRRVVTPAFTAEHLRAYHPHVVALTEERIAGWKVGETIDLTEEIEDLTAAIASKTFYGQDLAGQPRALAAIAREVALGLFSPLTKIPLDLPGTPYRRFVELTESAGREVLAEVERRAGTGYAGDDVLSMMLQAIEEGNVELSENQLVGNAFTLFLAGHDVPANALGLTLFLLAQHPRVAADLDDELTATLGGEAPTFDQLWKLPLLERVVKESLRVLSPAVLIWRRVHEPAELGGYELPAGTEVILSPYVTHVDPEIYPEPKRFRPERWETIKPTPYEYLPFSQGARKCLGAAFAEVLLRGILAIVLQRHRLELVPGSRVDLAVTFTMKPKGGLPAVVRPPDRRFEDSRVDVRGQIRELVEL